MMDLRNKVMLFRDNRYMLNGKSVYVFAKANYYNYASERTAPFEFFYKTFRTDEEARYHFELYKNDCLPNEITYKGLENFLKLNYLRPPATISALLHVLETGIDNYLRKVDTIISTEEILFIKHSELRLIDYNENNREWIFKGDGNNYYVIKHPFLVMEEIKAVDKSKDCLIIDTLFIKKPIRDLILLEDSGNKTFFRYR